MIEILSVFAAIPNAVYLIFILVLLLLLSILSFAFKHLVESLSKQNNLEEVVKASKDVTEVVDSLISRISIIENIFDGKSKQIDKLLTDFEDRIAEINSKHESRIDIIASNAQNRFNKIRQETRANINDLIPDSFRSVTINRDRDE